MKNLLNNSRFKLIALIIQSLLCSISIWSRTKGPNLVFVHVPKTAGTSIINELKSKIGLQLLKKTSHFLNFKNKGSVTFGHVSYLDLLRLGVINNSFHKSAYKFCIVRNPYHRIVSLFNYFKDTKIINQNINFENFLDNVYLKRPPIGIYNHLGISQSNPQVNWIIDSNGKFLVDDIFKIEEIEILTNTFKKKFKINLNIKKYNQSNKHITFKEIQKKRSIIEKIETIYGRDFDLLGYKRLEKK